MWIRAVHRGGGQNSLEATLNQAITEIEALTADQSNVLQEEDLSVWCDSYLTDLHEDNGLTYRVEKRESMMADETEERNRANAVLGTEA